MENRNQARKNSQTYNKPRSAVQRYKQIIDNWKQFQKECDRQERKTVRKNPIKSSEGVEQKLKEDFPDIEQADWNQNVYRLNSEKSAGKSMLHWLGEYYVQEESAALPVQILDPEPSEKVLDMCAAPGGKTTQIASKMDNKGTVIANDKNPKRLKSLHANIYRTGSTAANVVNYDGRRIPKKVKYDKILVDAPCSGEGNNSRRNFKSASEQELKTLSNIQQKLLENAEKLLKKDGRIVYSTCTFAPEENESVVEKTLENTDLRLENIQSDIEHVRGVKKFQDTEFSFQTSKTVRVYPHHMRSGGIYVARFAK
ncbi:NOL1/NOP2/sun family putative RNA methylase [Nanohaloarchaea archaeon]|nr:NOL1/NOP2/sun family putative RNA methylase [Candidatus Nanohaloarchaea archaeon]